MIYLHVRILHSAVPDLLTQRGINPKQNKQKKKKTNKKMPLYRRALGGPVAVLLFFGADTYPPRVPSVLVTVP